MRLADQDIGGAIVRKTFNTFGKSMQPGQRLTAEQVLTFRPANRNALIDKRFIEIFPKGATAGEKFVISAGFGRFYVIEGVKLNDEPIDREQAYALAGITEVPEKVKQPKRGKRKQ